MAREQTAQSAKAVTPNDGTDITATFGLYVAVTGDIKVNMRDGVAVTFAAVPAGTILPIQATRVFASGTTASGILALY